MLDNDIVLGSVNAARSRYEIAADVLARADRPWLESMITRREPMRRLGAALEQREDDVKTVIELA